MRTRVCKPLLEMVYHFTGIENLYPKVDVGFFFSTHFLVLLLI